MKSIRISDNQLGIEPCNPLLTSYFNNFTFECKYGTAKAVPNSESTITRIKQTEVTL